MNSLIIISLQRFEAPITIACFSIKPENRCVISESEQNSFVDETKSVSTDKNKKNMQTMNLEIIFSTIHLICVFCQVFESLEDTRIEGTLPPGSQAPKNQPVLVFTYLPKGKHIQHGLGAGPLNVSLDLLLQKNCERSFLR